MDRDTAETVDRVIRARRTTKVLVDEALPGTGARETVDELVATAGWAPFHKPAARVHLEPGAMTSIVPWRFHLVDAPACRAIREVLLERGDRSKIPRPAGAGSCSCRWLRPHRFPER